MPGQRIGTVADLVLSEDVSDDLRDRILGQAGFNNPTRALVNLKSLAGEGIRRDTFAKLALLAWDILKRKPDPDMALNNWERFIHSLASPEFHYNLLLSQPMRLDILLGIFSDSQFLADTLIRNPGFLDWVMTQSRNPGFRIKVSARNWLSEKIPNRMSNRMGCDRRRL